MATESTALLGDRCRPPPNPEESFHLKLNHTTINSDRKPENSHNETSVLSLSQGTDNTMLTGASNTVDIHDLLETLERASSIVKSHIAQRNGGHGLRRSLSTLVSWKSLKLPTRTTKQKMKWNLQC